MNGNVLESDEKARARKPALVFLCQRLPYPPIKGERITSFNLLRHLTRHYRVFVGTFIDDAADRAEIATLRDGRRIARR